MLKNWTQITITYRERTQSGFIICIVIKVFFLKLLAKLKRKTYCVVFSYSSTCLGFT